MTHPLKGQTVVICGIVPPEGGVLCSFSPSHKGGHSWEKVHVEQADPVHNDGPSMHDLVIKDILSRDLRWDLSVGSARHIRDQVAEDVEARKAVGLARYGTILQAHNGRDFLRDLEEELLDASVYARGRLIEVDEDSLEYLILFEVYDDIVSNLTRVRRLRNAVTE